MKQLTTALSKWISGIGLAVILLVPSTSARAAPIDDAHKTDMMIPAGDILLAGTLYRPAGATPEIQTLLSAALLSAIDAAPAAAETIMPLPKFDSIELNGGGTVILRYGQQQRVKLVRGSLNEFGVRVSKGERIRGGRNPIVTNRDQLIIDACKKGKCGEPAPVVEVVTPSVSAISVKNGGTLEARGPFPLQANVGAAVVSGGTMDLRAIPYSNVGASVIGGGTLLVRAERSLGASVQGGGDIRFWGNPAVGYSISGGGTILPGK